MITKIGLDLGYANITLSDVSSEIYREPAVALVYKDARSDSGRIIAVGNEAILSGAEHPDGVLVRPFKNGMLFDSQITREIIFNVIKAVQPADKIRCVVGVPSDILPRQEKELFSMLKEGGVDTVVSVARSVAALIGAGYSPNMSAISVNVGALATEISVLHRGEIIYMFKHNIGGEDFDKAVKQFILEQGDVNISLSVAKSIKERLGAVWKGKANDSIDIEGTLSLTGNMLHMNVTTEDIVGVFEKPVQALINAIVDAVKHIPNDIVEAVFENGIILTGGGSELYGLNILVEKILGISVTKPDNAEDCVARGLSRINGFINSRVNEKNITNQLAAMYESSKK